MMYSLGNAVKVLYIVPLNFRGHSEHWKGNLQNLLRCTVKPLTKFRNKTRSYLLYLLYSNTQSVLVKSYRL